MKHIVMWGVGCGGLAGLAGVFFFHAAPALVPFVIHTDKGSVHFEVERAQSPQERQKGLMWRLSLPERGGMLFNFEAEAIQAMWMKNTYISLDILFIRKDCAIVAFYPRTQPFSHLPLSSHVPISAALEVHAGTIEKWGVKVGDRVTYEGGGLHCP